MLRQIPTRFKVGSGNSCVQPSTVRHRDLSDGLRVGEEGDEGEGFLAGGTDQREGFMDSSQEGGPSGRPGRGGVWSLGWWAGWLRGWGRGGCWEERTWAGSLSGEGVVLLGPVQLVSRRGGDGGRAGLHALRSLELLLREPEPGMALPEGLVLEEMESLRDKAQVVAALQRSTEWL